MFSNDELKEINQFTQEQSRQISISSSSLVMACCVGPNGKGGYDFRTSDGRTLSGVIALDDTLWAADTWASLEQTNGGWVIAGTCAFDGGPAPAPA